MFCRFYWMGLVQNIWFSIFFKHLAWYILFLDSVQFFIFGLVNLVPYICVLVNLVSKIRIWFIRFDWVDQLFFDNRFLTQILSLNIGNQRYLNQKLYIWNKLGLSCSKLSSSLFCFRLKDNSGSKLNHWKIWWKLPCM